MGNSDYTYSDKVRRLGDRLKNKYCVRCTFRQQVRTDSDDSKVSVWYDGESNGVLGKWGQRGGGRGVEADMRLVFDMLWVRWWGQHLASTLRLRSNLEGKRLTVSCLQNPLCNISELVKHSTEKMGLQNEKRAVCVVTGWSLETPIICKMYSFFFFSWEIARNVPKGGLCFVFVLTYLELLFLFSVF